MAVAFATPTYAILTRFLQARCAKWANVARVGVACAICSYLSRTWPVSTMLAFVLWTFWKKYCPTLHFSKLAERENLDLNVNSHVTIVFTRTLFSRCAYSICWTQTWTATDVSTFFQQVQPCIICCTPWFLFLYFSLKSKHFLFLLFCVNSNVYHIQFYIPVIFSGQFLVLVLISFNGNIVVCRGCNESFVWFVLYFLYFIYWIRKMNPLLYYVCSYDDEARGSHGWNRTTVGKHHNK